MFERVLNKLLLSHMRLGHGVGVLYQLELRGNDDDDYDDYDELPLWYG